ncbi:DoxX family membrane protein [Lewinella sp. W8]|uniref:DoxX family membrane protein n=1 Tax=Lewinella sp. W8 TaxID=2528208 RepID=UPI001067E992|nr:DoxX family membrane protein [Lewinella sp. W8]MTB53719.1 DoxX family membrane protein [Lewinella sp. W8]
MTNYTKGQEFFLVVLRLAIGWHFLYEGVVKLWNPNWSARGYLTDSAGPFKDLFYEMGSNPTVLSVVDTANVWGLILIGLGLLFGFMTRWAALGGIILLGFYFLSHPPLIDVKYALPSEGSYLFINKNLIELFALGVLMVFPSSQRWGLDGLLKRTYATA